MLNPTPPRSRDAGRRGARRPLTREDGYVLALVALLMLPLVVFTAFAVDLGAWYAQGARMQRAVDSAALAGVVWLPNKAAAEQAATVALRANGYSGPASFSYPNSRQMEVGIERSGTRYFSQYFTDGPQKLVRSGTAEYNKPVPLGSPANSFGCTNPVSSGTGCAAGDSGIWAAINGPYTGHNQGDPYATKCDRTQTTAGGSTTYSPTSACDDAAAANGAKNPDYDPNGYLFAIDVPPAGVGAPITLELYDAVGANSSITIDGVSGTFTTEYWLYESDGSDVTVSTDPALSMASGGKCTTGPGRLVIKNDAAGTSTYKDQWRTLCQFTPSKSGIYPLTVKTSNISGVTDGGAGTNQFSIRATTGAAAKPQVYALDRMPIYSPGANAPPSGGSRISRFYLANIGQEHRGKTLIIDLFDPGDGSGSSTFTMQFRSPPGGAPSAVPSDSGGTVSCQYNSTKGNTIDPPPSTPDSSGTCSITTRSSGTSIYDNGWLRVKIAIPTTYSCTTDCWWTVKYNFGSTGSSTDRTVWRVQVVGDPVHLVG